REKSLLSNSSGQQDEATKAWNFCTALYYKANQIGPWRLSPNASNDITCYVGIGFYKSRNGQSLNTSLAQVFDDMGRSLILRGTPVSLTKDDRIPHLSSLQATELLSLSISLFRKAMNIFPARVVIHKSSLFTDEEIRGFLDATQADNIAATDMVSILSTTNTR